MRKAFIKIILPMVMVATVACDPVKEGGSADSSSVDPGTPATPTTDASPLYVVVESKYENLSDSSYIREGECSITSTAATPAEKNISCTVSIPELRLHYSKLKLTAGTSSTSLCPFILFQPYYYLKSNSNIPLSGNYEAYDCSGTKYLTKSFCWGGAGQNVIETVGFQFPQTASVYYTPVEGNLATAYLVESANKMAIANAKGVTSKSISIDQSYYSNVFAANSLPSGSRAASYIGNGVDYAGGGNYQDWTWSCRDSYGFQTYSITLTIDDQDTATAEGISNDYYDWN
jgi:hypothetical protein